MATADDSAPPTAVPLSTTPLAGQLVAHDGKTYDTIREGQAFILIPPNTRTSVDPKAGASTAGKKGQKEKGEGKKIGNTAPKDSASGQPQSVFYNPIQQFNRDLSVLAIKAFGEDWLRRKKVKQERSKERKRRVGKKRGIQVAEGDGNVVENNDDAKRVKSRDEGLDVDEEMQVDGGVRLDTTASETTAPETTAPKNSALDDGGHSVVIEGTTPVVQEPEADARTHQPTSKDPTRFRVLDALSATGLRALRYAKEIPFITAVVANDMNPNAIKSMSTNIEHNGLATKITTNVGDAIGHMYSIAYPPTHTHGPQHVNQRYDVIDLDPYGTAAPFIDAALHALNDGGMLCVTCTDSGVFASTGYSEKTYALYGGMPVKGPHMHEGGLRLIINSVATSAARHGLAIEPLLSLSIDYYVRIFIRVRKSPFEVKFLAGKTMLVYGCDHGCGAWTTQTLARNARQTGKAGNFWFKHTIAQGPTVDRLCEHCRSKMHVAGPMWAGPLHNQAFVEKILNDIQEEDPSVYETIPRIEGMLTTALEELSLHDTVTQYDPVKNAEDETTEMISQTPPDLVDPHPFFVNPSALSKVIHCIAPSDATVRGALRYAGYRAVRSHCQPGSIKTDAPWTVIWEIMREWVRQKSPIKEGALKEGVPGWHIMQAARRADDVDTNGQNAEPLEEADSPEIITELQTSSSNTVDTTNGATRLKVVFDEALGRDVPGKRLVRYQQNPRENWGPMSRAK